MNDVMYSSNKDDWATPQDFFDVLNAEFNFTLGAAADDSNAKCAKYFTKETNGLAQSWAGETVYLNPPYGRSVGRWVKKAYEEVKNGGAETVVMLLAALTDTQWFHDYIYHQAEIRFIKGRLKFGGAPNAAPFPSMVCIFRKETLA